MCLRLNAADVASVTKCLCVGRGTTICWGATLGVRLFVLTLNLYYSFGERLTSSGVTTSSESHVTKAKEYQMVGATRCI